MKKLLIMSIALLFGVTVVFAQSPARTVRSVQSSAQSSFNQAKGAAKSVKNSISKDGIDNPKSSIGTNGPFKVNGVTKNSKGLDGNPNTASVSGKVSRPSRRGTQSEPIRLIDGLTSKGGKVQNTSGAQKTNIKNPVRR